MATAPEQFSTHGPGGVRIVADRLGDPQARAVVFLHGGGQTRRSWARAAAARTARGAWPKLVAGLLAAAFEGVPLGAEGADVVAVGFAGLFVLDEGVEGMAGVGHLHRPVFAFGGA